MLLLGLNEMVVCKFEIRRDIPKVVPHCVTCCLGNVAAAMPPESFFFHCRSQVEAALGKLLSIGMNWNQLSRTNRATKDFRDSISKIPIEKDLCFCLVAGLMITRNLKN